MPIIELWRGIKFKMYFNDHNPPHFHVLYQGLEAVYSIDSCKLINGCLSPRVNKLVIQWWSINKDRLNNEWEKLSND